MDEKLTRGPRLSPLTSKSLESGKRVTFSSRDTTKLATASKLEIFEEGGGGGGGMVLRSCGKRGGARSTVV